MVSFALAATRAAAALRKPRVKLTMDRISGTVLIGLGVRLATQNS